MTRTYQGKYKIKNPEKYAGDPSNVVYRSMWEKNVMRFLDENTDVIGWSSEEIVIPYYYDVDKRYHRYFPDFAVKWKNGKTSLIEVKPNKETRPPKGNKRTKRYINEALTYVKNENKWEAAKEYCADRKWEFLIWTEVELESMGINKKPIKKLKPLKPYSRKKTK